MSRANLVASHHLLMILIPKTMQSTVGNKFDADTDQIQSTTKIVHA
jgi:hypothetical protein